MSEFEQMRQRMAERQKADEEAAEEKRLQGAGLSPGEASFAARVKVPGQDYQYTKAFPDLTPGQATLAAGIVLPK